MALPFGAADVCVMGAGPAGACIALRLASLGHRVTLVERRMFPRRHLGESLSPGVRPLLESINATGALASLNPIHRVDVNWGANQSPRLDAEGSGSLVDRALFDQALVEAAQGAGVKLLQPARVRGQHFDGNSWQLELLTPSGNAALEARYLVDATGRSGGRKTSCTSANARTLAVYGYWTGQGLSSIPRIESDTDEWRWRVPLPDGTHNLQIFIDAGQLRHLEGKNLSQWYQERLARCGWIPAGARLVGPVRAADATPYLDSDPVTGNRIKVGDSACAIDPLSSSGVQKAMQSAFAGAIVVNTMLRRPESHELACHFYRQHLNRNFDRHAAWASGYYAEALPEYRTSFWINRSVSDTPPSFPEQPARPPRADTLVELCSAIRISEQPCLVNDFVETRPAVHHPALEEPVVFVAGVELAPLLVQIRKPATPVEIARNLAGRVTPERAAFLTSWLFRSGLLVSVSREPARSTAGAARS